MKETQPTKPVSPKKLAANRENAQRSTGPKTSAGKQRAAWNSYKHGFFAHRLFPTHEVLAQDAENYDRILGIYWHHYMPLGDVEKLLVEKIAVESLRLARLLGHEQRILGWLAPFESRSVDRIVRYEASVSRNLEKTIAELERLQEERGAHLFESSDLPADGVSQESSEAVPGVISGCPQDLTTSTTAAPFDTSPGETHIERETSSASAESKADALTSAANTQEPKGEPTTGEHLSLPSEAAASKPPAPQIEATNIRATELIEPTVEEEPIGSSNFIETAEDAQFVQWVKDGKDLDLLTDEQIDQLLSANNNWKPAIRSSIPEDVDLNNCPDLF